jgi:hypothetical protein
VQGQGYERLRSPGRGGGGGAEATPLRPQPAARLLQRQVGTPGEGSNVGETGRNGLGPGSARVAAAAGRGAGRAWKGQIVLA